MCCGVLLRLLACRMPMWAADSAEVLDSDARELGRWPNSWAAEAPRDERGAGVCGLRAQPNRS